MRAMVWGLGCDGLTGFGESGTTERAGEERRGRTLEPFQLIPKRWVARALGPGYFESRD
jgi:hypothetical protein